MANADGTVSYPQGPATPLGKEIDAKKAFDRLFAGVDPGQTDTEAQMRLAMRKSVLDTALAEGGTLLNRLNAEDRIKVDELFTGIRQLEAEIQNTTPPARCTPPTAPATNLSQNFANQVDVHARAHGDRSAVRRDPRHHVHVGRRAQQQKLGVHSGRDDHRRRGGGPYRLAPLG